MDTGDRNEDRARSARERVAAEAVRKALQEDARRARHGLPLGAGVMIAGAAIAAAASQLPLGLVMTIIVGGVGLVIIPFGVAIVARSLRTIVVSERGQRELAQRERSE